MTNNISSLNKDILPTLGNKEPSDVTLEGLDTSKMSALEMALYHNALARVNTVTYHNKEKLRQATEKATKAAIETTKIEAIKNLLTIGVCTIDQIAQVLSVSTDFVKKVQDSLNDPQKPVQKTRSKKNINK